MILDLYDLTFLAYFHLVETYLRGEDGALVARFVILNSKSFRIHQEI